MGAVAWRSVWRKTSTSSRRSSGEFRSRIAFSPPPRPFIPRPSKSKSSSSSSSSSSSPVSGIDCNFCNTRSIPSSSPLSSSSSLSSSSPSPAAPCFMRRRMTSGVCAWSCRTKCGRPGAMVAGKLCEQASWKSRRNPRMSTFLSAKRRRSPTCCIQASKTCWVHCRSSAQRRKHSALYQSIIANVLRVDLRSSDVSTVGHRLQNSSK
mmetsp:Transcript_97752/g.218150  ORF Transcript_97752/g.218150 Transcript_97752/m.218150 type:complete len:207 (-) Transcript_97752:1403-2023(-)